MNKYIRESLEPGEEILCSGRLHWSSIFLYLLWGTVLVACGVAGAIYTYQRAQPESSYLVSLALGVLGLMVWGAGHVIRSRREFAVTPQRFVQKDGLFTVSLVEIPLNRVETVNYTQTLGQRILGTGSIELVGSGGTRHLLRGIERPGEVRRVITAALKPRHEEFGVRNEERPAPAPSTLSPES